MLLMGYDGSNQGEQVLQINPTTMARTARYQNWAGGWNSASPAVGDGSRLHVGFWDIATRSVLQFAEEGTPLCEVCGKVAIGDKVFLLPIGNYGGNRVALKSDKAALTDKALIAPLDEQAVRKLAFRNCIASVNDKVVCAPIGNSKKDLLAVR